MKYEFTIPLNPVSKKNSPIVLKNRAVVLPSKQYMKYEKECKPYIPKFDEAICTPCNVECHFYLKTRRLCDLTNMLESIHDVLVKYGVLEDDNYTRVATTDGSFVSYDKENPRTEIVITEYDYPCAICKRRMYCGKDDFEFAVANAYNCFSRGRK